MQTGPTDKQSMERWLLWTGLLEMGNAVLFTLIVWYWSREVFPESIGYLTVAGLATLNVLLVEGGAYWLLKRAGFFGRSSGSCSPRLLRYAYAANAALLLVFPAGLVAATLSVLPTNGADALIGLFWYLFALGEFVHYFCFKINMRPRELRDALRKRKPVPARLLRELRAAERRTGPGG